MVHALPSVLFMEMNNGFRVAPAAITMTAFLQLLAQFLVVVNFTVVNEPYRAIFVRDGFLPRLLADDAETAHRQANVLGNVKSVFVRTSMNDLPVHRFDDGTV